VIVVVKTHQRVGVLSGSHRWRWTAERARRYVEAQDPAPGPCDLRVAREGNRWAVVAYQNYATDSEDMASWIRALDVELAAGDITKAEFETEVSRLSQLLKARVR
jgi:hypothetical protein